MTDRPRILVLGDPGPAGDDWLKQYREQAEIVQVSSWTGALEKLRQESFTLFLASPDNPSLASLLHRLLQAERILLTMADGVALVDSSLTIRWANPTFELWCGGPAVGQDFYEALGIRAGQVVPCPFRQALSGFIGSEGNARSICTRVSCRHARQVELSIAPVAAPEQEPPLLLALGRDVTQLTQQQQQLDALHQAGRKLADLTASQLGEMSPAERIELLKSKILRYFHDLFHYEILEIRLLDRQTGLLEPLLQEGMTPEAASRKLRPGLTGFGVTGWVAASLKSYVCTDTSRDPLYIPGAPGARSSLTVPLLYQDQMIGTLNIESPEAGAFDDSDVRFAETFGREVAAALHTLELLSAEQKTAASQSVEAISREVALPVDEILTNTTAMLDRYIGHDPEIAERLRKVLASARSIKQCIQSIGEDLGPAPATTVVGDHPVPPTLKGLRVLVTDNDDRVRRSAHSLLGRWGCIVETARDGQEALTMARLSSYDAILADIRLPDMGGYEVYQKLREAQPHAQVILMTGYGYDPTHSLVKARQDGLQHVLYKPFRVDQLLRALAAPAPQEAPASCPPRGTGEVP